MELVKCKNSVFCSAFFFFFCIGTICGVVLFNIYLRCNCNWIELYCGEIFCGDKASFLSVFLSCLRPLLIVWLTSFFSFSNKIVPIFVLCRGCVISYFFSFALLSGYPLVGLALKELVLLTAYYYILSNVALHRRVVAVLLSSALLASCLDFFIM